ncbi:MAG TPA: hypothetical protein VJ600_08405 [Holophagaceae bacterium]|nr:hypothetical protein [Holophagaceae bacterium]
MTGILLQPAAQAPAPAHLQDRGFLVIVGALIFCAILAHRYWRAKIRLEDELVSVRKDLGFHLGRYQRAWRNLQQPAALADRASGLVIEATPGWVALGLPASGAPLHGGDEAVRSAWAAIPAPDADGRAGGARELVVAGRPLRAQPLEGEGLGLVLVEPR